MTIQKPYFPILEAEISRNGIRKKDIAIGLGIKPRTLSLKLTGKTEFLLSEVIYIHSIFSDTPIEDLFAITDTR